MCVKRKHDRDVTLQLSLQQD